MAETALTSSAVASSDDIVAAHPNTIRADLINHTHGGTVTPVIAADTIKTLTGARTLTLPTGQDDTVVTLGATQTLTAKTLTSPTINTPTSGTGIWGINETANANMTTGLTINQGAADDEIQALKSSDVAHGMTDLAETDTYALFKKSAATTGGLLIRGLDDGAASSALQIEGNQGAAADTTKSTAGAGVVVINAAVKSGTTRANVGADGNLLSVSNNGTTRLILDAEGTLHSIGATSTERFGDGSTLLVAPTIADFTNANHDHGDADDGGATLTSPAINGATLNVETIYSGLLTVTSQFDKTDTDLANITGLSLTLTAGQTYSFRALLMLNNGVGGAKFGIGGTCTATAIRLATTILDTTTTLFALSTALGATSGQTTATGENLCILEGTITVNAGGTFVPQFAQVSASGTSSVLVGSSLEVKKRA